MKILHIANDYFHQQLYKRLFVNIDNIGIENDIYVPVNVKEQPIEGLERENPKVIADHCFSDFDRFLFFSKQRKIYNSIILNTCMNSIDMVHAHTLFSAGYTAYNIKTFKGIPYCVVVRNTDKNVFFKYMVHLRKIGVDIMLNAKKVIFLSEPYKIDIIEKYVPEKYKMEIYEKSEVIPNGISPIFFESQEKLKMKLSSEITLIYVGEINRNKNLETTVSAVKALRKQDMKIRLKVVGEIQHVKYEKIIKKNDFIEHFNKCSQNEVIVHLRTADIFVMPSHHETFGLVYAEAMSQGLPVIYTRGQGFDQQFPEGTVGYSVSDTNPDEIAEKIKQIISNYSTISENCTKYVDKFKWENIAQRYKEIYKEAVGEIKQ